MVRAVKLSLIDELGPLGHSVNVARISLGTTECIFSLNHNHGGGGVPGGVCGPPRHC